jgi:hypothetical protein
MRHIDAAVDLLIGDGSVELARLARHEAVERRYDGVNESRHVDSVCAVTRSHASAAFIT